MEDKEEKVPYYLRRIPFFIISYLFAPLAYILLFIKWRTLDSSVRDARLIVASLFLLLFIVDFFPTGIYQNIVLATAITVGLFITFVGLGGGTK
ncbi:MULTISPECIES: hypothetical protein [unclassified Exiguobacterium]|uniref:hypothetical protein n=1 Tax=unclassified Exiguobacterium TaxID=2644629 RepID=UPI0006455CC7|nr:MULTISPECIES: hypothetical protein [unclassified Exiguobacterium]HBQ76625.1 hypothetical protein [Exiguobacterium sp.]